MPATARKPAVLDAANAAPVRVVALTHAFQDLRRYRRGEELDITLPPGQPMPAWCIAASDAPRDRDGRINHAELPLFFPASTRS